ncbi:MAG: AgmX/PglI C-terminal domain-containing protein [Polyangiaceae bacterium]
MQTMRMMRNLISALLLMSAAACGSTPPPKPPPAPEPVAELAPAPPQPVMQQELGSIDDGAVEEAFVKLAPELETCHAKGRTQNGMLAGDVTVFLRIDAQGQVRYSYFQSSTLGDRDTEKCILELLAATTWPKPTGGEAEVTHGLGWTAGGERAPVDWGSEKVTFALDGSPSTRHALDQCKRGASGVQMTGYVTNGPPIATDPPKARNSKTGKSKKARKKPAKSRRVKVGHFRALGGASTSKDGAEKIDCAISVLKNLALPSPGSTTAKVSFGI